MARRHARDGQVHQGIEAFEPRNKAEIFWDHVFNFVGDYRRPVLILLAVLLLWWMPTFVVLWWLFLVLSVVVFGLWIGYGSEKDRRELRQFNRRLSGTPERNGLAANLGLINRAGEPPHATSLDQTSDSTTVRLFLPAGIPPSAVEDAAESLIAALGGYRGEVQKIGAAEVELSLITRDTLEETVEADWLTDVQHSSAPPAMPDEFARPFWEDDDLNPPEGGKTDG